MIGEDGVARCDNCGADRFTSPQLVESPEGGMSVFLACANCSTPMYTGMTESDPEVIESLKAFFADPEAYSQREGNL